MDGGGGGLKPLDTIRWDILLHLSHLPPLSWSNRLSHLTGPGFCFKKPTHSKMGLQGWGLKHTCQVGCFNYDKLQRSHAAWGVANTPWSLVVHPTPAFPSQHVNGCSFAFISEQERTHYLPLQPHYFSSMQLFPCQTIPMTNCNRLLQQIFNPR